MASNASCRHTIWNTGALWNAGLAVLGRNTSVMHTCTNNHKVGRDQAIRHRMIRCALFGVKENVANQKSLFDKLSISPSD